VSLFFKITFPLLLAVILIILAGIAKKKISVNSVVLLVITFILLALIGYPVGDYFYKKKYNLDSNEYHTYLQLVPPVPNDYDSTKFNILCLGGSTTEFKDDKGRDWPGMVENKLKTSFNLANIKVYNLGRIWYTTQHSLTNYIQNLRKHKPDMIIIMHAINDAWHNADFSRFSNGPFRIDYGHYLGPEAYMIKAPSLFSYLSDILSQLWYADDVQVVNTKEFPGLTSFRNNLTTLIQLARIDSTEVLLMTQPNLFKDTMSSEEIKSLTMLNKEAAGNGKRWSVVTGFNAMNAYNEAVVRTAEKEKTGLIDLDKKIPKTLEYFYDDVHYKGKSYDLIADIVAQRIYHHIIQDQAKK